MLRRGSTEKRFLGEAATHEADGGGKVAHRLLL